MRYVFDVSFYNSVQLTFHFCLTLFHAMLSMCTFFLSMLCLCVYVKSNTYNPSSYREPTRRMKDLMLKIEHNVVDIMFTPQSVDRGTYLLKFLIGYSGLLDRTIKLLKEKKVEGYEIFRYLNKRCGPAFIKLTIETMLPNMQSTFQWTSKKTSKFNELIEATKFKWFQVRTLGKQMVDDLPS